MKRAFLIGLCCLLLTGCAENSVSATPSKVSVVTTVKSTDMQTEVQMERTAEDVTTSKAVTSTVSIETTPVNTSTAKAIAGNIVSETYATAITKTPKESLTSTQTTTVTALETSITMTSAAASASSVTTYSKPKLTTTTAKQKTAAMTTTTTVTTTTTAATTAVTTTTNPDEQYIEVGRNLNHDGTDYGKAKAVYDWMTANGHGTCVNYSCQTYLVCEGIGLDCYCCWTDAGIYGHVANVVKVNGIWFVLDTQAGGFLDYNYGFTEIIDINEIHVADGNIISDYSYRELYE